MGSAGVADGQQIKQRGHDGVDAFDGWKAAALVEQNEIGAGDAVHALRQPRIRPLPAVKSRKHTLNQENAWS